MKTYFQTFALVICALVLAGCREESAARPDKAGKSEAPAHDHGAGPHGGAIGDWGNGDYHVEFTVDHDTKEATVYVLGSDGKTAAPVKAETLLLTINEPAFEVELSAQPLEDEKDGTSSRFVGRHDKLGTVREFAGTISGEVNGTPYSGDFREVAHEH
jgi:hypothetical protein